MSESGGAPVVGVVIPVRNGGSLLGKTLDSVRAQSMGDWVCRVVDDGSTDDSFAVAEAAARADDRIQVFRCEWAGQSLARNRGYAELPPETRYVTFMDADDLWTPDALGVLADALSGDPGAVGAHGLGDFIDELGQPLDPGSFADLGRSRVGCRGGWPRPVPLDQPTRFENLATASVLFPPGLVLARRSALERVGLFDLAVAEDWDLMIRLSRLGHFAFVNRVLLAYRRRPGNNSTWRPALGAATVRVRTFYSPENSPTQQRLVRDAWRAAQVVDARSRLAQTRRALGAHDLSRAVLQGARLPSLAVRYGRGRPRPDQGSPHGVELSGRQSDDRTEMAGPVVMGFTRGMAPRYVTPFLTSLRATGYGGRVCLFVADTPARDIAELRGQADQVVTVDYRYPLMAPQWAVSLLQRFRATRGLRRHYRRAFAEVSRFLGATPGSPMAYDLELRLEGIQSLRYRHYREYLLDHPEASPVMISDLRDVWFQDDPFAREVDDLECYLEEPSAHLKAPGFNSAWLADLYGEAGLASLPDAVISCSGVTVGTRQGMLRYLEAMTEEVASVAGLPLGPHDQGIHNWLLYTGRLDPVRSLANGHGRVLTMGLMAEPTPGADGLVRNADGSVPAVLHQYDRHVGLTRALLGSSGSRPPAAPATAPEPSSVGAG